MRWYWLSSQRLTIGVATDSRGTIRITPPIARRFRGQPLGNLIRWMQSQGGFRFCTLEA